MSMTEEDARRFSGFGRLETHPSVETWEDCVPGGARAGEGVLTPSPSRLSARAPSARMTFILVPNSGFPPGESAL